MTENHIHVVVRNDATKNTQNRRKMFVDGKTSAKWRNNKNKIVDEDVILSRLRRQIIVMRTL